MADRIRRRWSTIIPLSFLAIGAVAVVLPFTWMIATSMRSASTAFDLPPPWVPTRFSTENYRAAFDQPVPLATNAWNSAYIAVITTVLAVSTSALAGYALARIRFRGRSVMFIVFLSSMMLPLQVTIVPLYVLMQRLGLEQSRWALILPAALNPLGIFLMRQFFSTLPSELFEAARIDGAGQWRLFSRIALPLAKPGLAALAVIVFLLSWNSYFAPLIFLNDLDRATLPLGLVQLLGPFRTGNPAVLMAATTLAILPALIAFVASSKWLVETLSRSGGKG
jgi:multiple sugar transport system permease protein